MTEIHQLDFLAQTLFLKNDFIPFRFCIVLLGCRGKGFSLSNGQAVKNNIVIHCVFCRNESSPKRKATTLTNYAIGWTII